jgi:hypothetical protein
MVGKMNAVRGGGGGVTVNPRVRLEMSRRKKIDGSDYHVRERCVTEN